MPYYGFIYRFTYSSEGLIHKKQTDDKMTILNRYDPEGRLVNRISPIGVTINPLYYNIDGIEAKSQLQRSVMDQVCGNISLEFEDQDFLSRSGDRERTIRIPTRITIAENGDGPVNVYNWEPFINMKQRNFDGVSGIGKHFVVNGNKVLTAEMHPRSGIQSIYNDAGKELLR